MDTVVYSPIRISIDKLASYKNLKVKPIDGLVIPNITVPPHLVSKKRITEAEDKLTINIRQLFNSVTFDNIHAVREQLRIVIIEKAKTIEMIKEIADEILINFLVNEQNIGNYMCLLNSIYPMGVLHENDMQPREPKTIGQFFLFNCRNLILEHISETKTRLLAELDQYDPDELDKYATEREKNTNLLVTLCYLYKQRDTTGIKLRAQQLYPLLTTILDSYKSIKKKMSMLGDPDIGFDTDDNEIEYDMLRKMSVIYAEQLYVFVAKCRTDCMDDQSVINNGKMSDIIHRFKTEVIPTLTEAFLISKCEELGL